MPYSYFDRNTECVDVNSCSMSILFKTKLPRDIGDMPLSNTHILGVSSLWMCIPIFHGVTRAWHEGDVFLAVLSCTLVAVCGVSTLFWSEPVTDSSLHRADKALCWLFAFELVWYSLDKGLEPSGLSVLGMFIVLLYLLSDLCFRKGLWVAQLLAHLLFRFAFYWWVHVLMVPPERNLLAGFLVLTLSYFAHASVLYRCMLWNSSSTRTEQYWLSCAALVCWVWLNGLAHCDLNKFKI